MPKLETMRVYESNDALPRGWSFPHTLLMAKKFTRLGVAVMIPLDGNGDRAGESFQMDLKLLVEHYHLMHKRKQDALISKERREKMAGYA